MSAALVAAGAVLTRDWRIWTSYRTRAFSTVFGAVVGVTLFYYVSRLVGGSGEFGSPGEYFGFVVIGMVILEVLTSTLTAPIGTLRAELLTGTFERMVVSPFGPVASILSMMLFPLALGLATGMLTLVLAATLFGLDLHWATAPLAIPVAVLGAAAFTPFGLLLSAAVMTFKQTNAGAAFIVTGLSLVAGLYFPVSLLPDWIEWTADVQPFTPAVDLLRHLLVGTPMRGSSGLALLKLAAFAAGMLPIALLVLRAAVDRSRRKGTITEY
jgi:ABC-2 type transport system permease protein